MIMGKETERSSDRSLAIYRGQELLESGDDVAVGDELVVKLEPKSFQMVLEVSGGFKFADQSPCHGTRSNKNGAIIVVESSSSSGNNNLTVVGVWAKSYSGGVKITEPVSLFLTTSEPEL